MVEVMNKPSILIIDDNDIDNMVAKYLIEKIEKADNLTIKGTVSQAIKYLEKLDEKPEYIILDIYLPLYDGFFFMDELRKHKDLELDKTKLVILSSNIDEEIEEKLEAYPEIDKVISKPLTIEKVESLF